MTRLTPFLDSDVGRGVHAEKLLLVAGHLLACKSTRFIGYWILDIGYWILDIGSDARNLSRRLQRSCQDYKNNAQAADDDETFDEGRVDGKDGLEQSWELTYKSVSGPPT